MRCGEVMLHIKKGSAYGDRSCTNSFLPWILPDYYKQLPSNLEIWRQPGIVEEEEKIWRHLDLFFSDAGFTLWPRAYFSVFMSPDRTYPMSSGFGYARTDDPDEVGRVSMLQVFEFPVS